MSYSEDLEYWSENVDEKVRSRRGRSIFCLKGKVYWRNNEHVDQNILSKRGRSKQCHSQGTPVAGAAAALFMKILHFFSKLTLGYCTSRPGVCVVGVCIGAVGGLIRTELSVIDGEYGGGYGALFDKVINVCPQEVIF